MMALKANNGSWKISMNADGSLTTVHTRVWSARPSFLEEIAAVCDYQICGAFADDEQDAMFFLLVHSDPLSDPFESPVREYQLMKIQREASGDLAGGLGIHSMPISEDDYKRMKEAFIPAELDSILGNKRSTGKHKP